MYISDSGNPGPQSNVKALKFEWDFLLKLKNYGTGILPLLMDVRTSNILKVFKKEFTYLVIDIKALFKALKQNLNYILGRHVR